MIKYISNAAIAAVIVVFAISLPVHADDSGKAFSKGVHEERNANYDAAFEAYKEAYVASPKNAKYFSAYTRMRFTAANQHVHDGEMMRTRGLLAEAAKAFQRASEIDPTSSIAKEELRQTIEQIELQQRRVELRAEPKKVDKLEDYGATIELKPLSMALVTLKLSANSDVLYKTIGKLAGLNVILDPDFRPQKTNLELTDVTVRDALNMLAIESKSFWRPALANTIVVASDSGAKRKELEQNVMQTFYMRNVSTPAELQDAANVVRQILDITHIQLLQGQDAMILRATPDQMLLAEKLLADLDKPKSEVVIDITVMQVSRDRLRTLGANVPTSVSVGITPPSSSGSSASSAVASAAGAVYKIGSFAISVPGGSFTALSSDSNTKILQSPQIRALNNEKATLRIGDRVPIATGSFSPGLAGGVSSVVSTQFTYLDVGVNIDVTPHVHSDSEVTLKMALEISSVTGSESIGGITQPIIGQRRIELDTRLIDGEVNLLGGILEDSETKSLSGLPWVSKLPILKYLFAQENKDRSETEIVFAITPHIVRALDITESNKRSITVGTGSSIELRKNSPPQTNAGPDPASSASKAPVSKPAASKAPSSPAASTPAPNSPVSQAIPPPVPAHQ